MYTPIRKRNVKQLKIDILSKFENPNAFEIFAKFNILQEIFKVYYSYLKCMKFVIIDIIIIIIN